MSEAKSLREWYHDSQNGRRDFFAQLESLTCAALTAILQQEVSTRSVGRLRSRSELRSLPRTSCPPIETLSAAAPSEQTLQWAFIHRGYLGSADQPILFRELPSCCAGESVLGRADLLAFDSILKQPILVELKDEDACDPLCGAVLEVLYHWSFYMRHEEQSRALLGELGCEAAGPYRLAIAAPARFYAEAARRSRKRNGEYERALEWIAGLTSRQVVQIELLEIETTWQQEVHFHMKKRFPHEQAATATR